MYPPRQATALGGDLEKAPGLVRSGALTTEPVRRWGASLLGTPFGFLLGLTAGPRCKIPRFEFACLACSHRTETQVFGRSAWRVVVGVVISMMRNQGAPAEKIR